VINLAASAMIVPTMGAIKSTKNPKLLAITLPKKDNPTETTNASGKSNHIAVSKDFC
jgi:hypothetical protein